MLEAQLMSTESSEVETGMRVGDAALGSFIEPAWLLRLLRETATVMWRTSEDGYVVDIPQWAALTGQSKAEIEGEGWMAALHPEDLDRVRAAWNTAVTHRSLYNTDYRVRCADGIYRWFNARGIPILDVEGDVICWVGTVLAIPGFPRPGRITRQPKNTLTPHFSDITPGALRAARGLLGWSAEHLAEASGVSISTIRRLESRGDDATASARRSNVAKLLNALSDQNLTLLGEEQIVSGVLEGRVRP